MKKNTKKTIASLLLLTLPALAAIPQQEEVIEAALGGKADIVKKALAEGYQPDTRDPEGRTALMYAAFNGQTNVVNLLIAAKADVNAQDKAGATALMFAASGPFKETIQILIDHGAKVNTIDTNEHWTALMWAAAEGQAENVKLLLKYKADPTLKDVDGDTAESFAAKNKHTEVVKILQATAPKKTEATKPNTKKEKK